MKLSKAIRLNGMVKKQGRGSASMVSPDAPCALGGAIQEATGSVAASPADAFRLVRELWPWSNERIADCPHCQPLQVVEKVYEVIYHLNDQHGASRAQIADWVELIEPAEEPTPDDKPAFTDFQIKEALYGTENIRG